MGCGWPLQNWYTWFPAGDNDCHVWAAPKKRSRSRRRHTRNNIGSRTSTYSIIPLHVFAVRPSVASPFLSCCSLDGEARDERTTYQEFYIYNWHQMTTTATAILQLGLIARRRDTVSMYWRRRVSCYEIWQRDTVSMYWRRRVSCYEIWRSQ
jgi:hypothetical protein